MSSSPPDISSLSLSSRPSQQRLHDTYDYDANSANRSPFHFATSQGLPQSPYNHLTSINQSPIKNKPVRSTIPAVRFFFLDLPRLSFSPPSFSNGLTTLLQTVGRSLPTITQTFLPLAAPLPWAILTSLLPL